VGKKDKGTKRVDSRKKDISIKPVSVLDVQQKSGFSAVFGQKYTKKGHSLDATRRHLSEVAGFFRALSIYVYR
tara:strand:+ start:2833 stop:3051 length:219 start_codon:yes stop_codon:yes gene_type:complete